MPYNSNVTGWWWKMFTCSWLIFFHFYTSLYLNLILLNQKHFWRKPHKLSQLSYIAQSQGRRELLSYMVIIHNFFFSIVPIPLTWDNALSLAQLLPPSCYGGTINPSTLEAVPDIPGCTCCLQRNPSGSQNWQCPCSSRFGSGLCLEWDHKNPQYVLVSPLPKICYLGWS